MPFGLVGRLGQRMRQVIGIGDCPTQMGNFGVGYGASNCNQWGTLLRSCAKVREAIELPFGAVYPHQLHY